MAWEGGMEMILPNLGQLFLKSFGSWETETFTVLKIKNLSELYVGDSHWYLPY